MNNLGLVQIVCACGAVFETDRPEAGMFSDPKCPQCVRKERDQNALRLARPNGCDQERENA